MCPFLVMKCGGVSRGLTFRDVFCIFGKFVGEEVCLSVIVAYYLWIAALYPSSLMWSADVVRVGSTDSCAFCCDFLFGRFDMVEGAYAYRDGTVLSHLTNSIICCLVRGPLFE